jgi:hypothetical protein
MIVVEGGGHGDGHNILNQQPTMKLTMSMVLKISAFQVSSVLIVVFSFVFSTLIEVVPTVSHHGDKGG